MSRKQKIIVSVTGIFLVLLILVGLTYAYFLTKIKGNENNKSISVTTANLLLEYADVNDELITDGAVEPGKTWTKTFVATNKGNKTVTYGVALENVVNTLERKEDLVYTLECKQYSKTGFSIDKTNKTVTGTISGTCNGVSEETTFPSIGTILVQNDIADDKAQVYTLVVTYKEMNVDQSVDMNKTFSAKANIVDPNTFGAFGSGTLASAIYKSAEIAASISDVTRTIYQETPITTPGQAASTETEKALSKTQDDYGDSYYFRGNVVDNFVEFAGMCWRIVRIEGDGSVKLILEDQNTTCNSNTFTGNWSDGNTYSFGTPDSFKNELENFQATKILNYTDKLKNDDWCYDDVVTDEDKDWQYGGEKYGRYNAYKRIVENKMPSLICTGSKLNAYIGTLTADEISFAGRLNYSHDNIYYLTNNHERNNRLVWWTSSYSSLDPHAGGYAEMLFVSDLGEYHADASFNSYIRPAVTILSNIQISSGDGTQQNPYIIK